MYIGFLIFAGFNFGFSAQAAEEVAQTFTFDGRAYADSAATAPMLDTISTRIQILNAAQDCILYEETQSINTTATNGYFTIQIGSAVGAAKRSVNDSGRKMSQVFSNTGGVISGKLISNGAACSYNPTSGDKRYVRLQMTPAGDNVVRTISPNMALDTVPSAMVAERAESLQGLSPASFLQVNNTGANALSQANLESLFSVTNFSRLSTLTSVAPSNYVQTGTNGSASIPSVAGNPGSALAAGQIWYDSTNSVLKYYDGSVKTIGTTSAATGFANGGNSYGAAANLGTNDAFALNFKTNNTTKMSLLSNGNVGIGSSSPTALLTVKASGNQTVTRTENSSGSAVVSTGVENLGSGFLTVNNSAGNPKVNLRTDSAISPFVLIDGQGGNIADGTGNFYGAAMGIYVPATVGNENGIIFPNNGNIVGAAITSYTAANTVYGIQGLKFKTGNGSGTVTRMTINETGNVGIGTTGPSAKLEVAGAVKIGDTTATCDATLAGAVRWLNSGSVLQVCNGTGWVSVSMVGAGTATQTPAAPTGSGYFVLSSGTYTGNMGGTTGANASCLSELTTNNWKGKDAALANGQLVASKVKAFLCWDYDQQYCQNLIPAATYYFARVGDTSVGGAYMTLDGDGKGPNNQFNWAAANYFGGNYIYWSNRRNFDGWKFELGGNSQSGGAGNCNWWTSSAPASAPLGATSNSTAQGRYSGYWTSCDQALNLVCVVNP